MQMRRMSRLMNAFCKKWDNLWSVCCLHFAHYNFWRIHRLLRHACDGAGDHESRLGTGGVIFC
jgi:hypothetical protein